MSRPQETLDRAFHVGMRLRPMTRNERFLPVQKQHVDGGFSKSLWRDVNQLCSLAKIQCSLYV